MFALPAPIAPAAMIVQAKLPFNLVRDQEPKSAWFARGVLKGSQENLWIAHLTAPDLGEAPSWRGPNWQLLPVLRTLSAKMR